MNLTQRSKYSLCQFLTLFEYGKLVLLIEKYGLSIIQRQHWDQICEVEVKNAVFQASDLQLESVIQELARTHDSMRNEVSPRYKYDDRWEDLCRCLEIDGYAREQKKEKDLWSGGETITTGRFVSIEPVIAGAAPVEDDMTRELERSGLPEREEILRVLDNSAESFRKGDFNGCLSNSRVALQTLATSIAQARRRSFPFPENFDVEKWGCVVAHLRNSKFLTWQQEKGVVGVFTFISPGAHVPVGFGEEEFARLGRSLAVSFCFFLVRQFKMVRH